MNELLVGELERLTEMARNGEITAMGFITVHKCGGTANGWAIEKLGDGLGVISECQMLTSKMVRIVEQLE